LENAALRVANNDTCLTKRLTLCMPFVKRKT
jgi:hypothetical protein